MWIAFDSFQLIRIVEESPDGCVHVEKCGESPAEILERALELAVEPVAADILDIDDATRAVRRKWPNCLLTGRDEAGIHAMLVSVFGGGGPDNKWLNGRFVFVEVPDETTFGHRWIADEPGEPPREASPQPGGQPEKRNA